MKVDHKVESLRCHLSNPLPEQSWNSTGVALSEKAVFLVVVDGQLQVTGDDPGLLVVTDSISCQLKNLSGQVFHHGGQVHGGTGSDALTIVALAEQTVDTAHGEQQTGTA